MNECTPLPDHRALTVGDTEFLSANGLSFPPLHQPCRLVYNDKSIAVTAVKYGVLTKLVYNRVNTQCHTGSFGTVTLT